MSNPDGDILVKKVSWRDNPFFPEVLNRERLRLQASDEKAYRHVWEGEFDERHFGGIYAAYVDKARLEGRICPVPYKDGVPVVTAWDLGKSDATCIWFAQIVGFQARIIDYYEASGKDLPHYASVIRSKPYEYKTHYLPHDAAHERLGMGGSISQQIRELGIPNTIINIGSVAARIENGRELLKTCYIDDTKCKDGIHALMHYQYEWDDARQKFKDSPRHDWASDPSDAFGYLSQVVKSANTSKPIKRQDVPSGSVSWMGI